MTKANGGTKIVLVILCTVVAAGILAVNDRVLSKQDDHGELIGHPAMVERVNGIQADMAEVKANVKETKADVKELLRRL